MHLAKDIVTYICSEFVYYNDMICLMTSCSNFNTTPYQFNFECNDPNLKIKHSVFQNLFFNTFTITKQNMENLQKMNIISKIVKTSKKFNSPISHLPKHFEEIYFRKHYNQPLPENLSHPLKKIIFGSKFNCLLPQNLPESLQEIHFDLKYNQPLPQNLPQTLKEIHFGSDYNQQLPENLPQSLQLIHFGYD